MQQNPWLDAGVWRYARILPESVAKDAVARFKAMGWESHIEVYDEQAPNWFYVQFIHIADPLADDSPPPMPMIDRATYHTSA